MNNIVEEVEEATASEEAIKFQCNIISADLKLAEIKLLLLKYLKNKK